MYRRRSEKTGKTTTGDEYHEEANGKQEQGSVQYSVFSIQKSPKTYWSEH
jgi:hypothetical protein